MGVYESCVTIKKVTKDLYNTWEQTKSFWKDAKSRQFEEEFIKVLSAEIKKAETALDNIGPVINRIRSELKG